MRMQEKGKSALLQHRNGNLIVGLVFLTYKPSWFYGIKGKDKGCEWWFFLFFLSCLTTSTTISCFIMFIPVLAGGILDVA